MSEVLQQLKTLEVPSLELWICWRIFSSCRTSWRIIHGDSLLLDSALGAHLEDLGTKKVPIFLGLFGSPELGGIEMDSRTPAHLATLGIESVIHGLFSMVEFTTCLRF
jgi:hypothetical protein